VNRIELENITIGFINILTTDDMDNYGSIKKIIDDSDRFINNIYESKLAKEILLKDDEKTPKQLNEKILDELTENLKVYKSFLSDVKENVKSGVLSKDEEVKLSFNLEEIKNILNLTPEYTTSKFDLQPFTQLELGDNKGQLAIFYQINTKAPSNVSKIVYIRAIDTDNSKTKELSNKETVFGNPINLGWGTKGSYVVTVQTEFGSKFRLKFGD
jgi:hypothetical protein